jgi:ubiquinone/menaquinone biosynthesis C-methylase UbiE
VVNIDQLTAEVNRLGYETWRRKEWPESAAMASIIAARQYSLLVRWINERVQPASKILDWGSGACIFSYALAKDGHNVSAIDWVEPPLRPLIERSGPGTFEFVKATDATHLPFDPSTFDVVLSIGVLEHVRETGGDEMISLGEIARVLRPAGTFICYHFPNKWSYIEMVARRLAKRGTYFHPHRYRPKDIARLAEDAGLTLEEYSSYGAIPRNPLSRLPSSISQSSRFADAVDLFDGGLAKIMTPFVQNFGWIARKGV